MYCLGQAKEYSQISTVLYTIRSPSSPGTEDKYKDGYWFITSSGKIIVKEVWVKDKRKISIQRTRNVVLHVAHVK